MITGTGEEAVHLEYTLKQNEFGAHVLYAVRQLLNDPEPVPADVVLTFLRRIR